jgi:hypothetical protein
MTTTYWIHSVFTPVLPLGLIGALLEVPLVVVASSATTSPDLGGGRGTIHFRILGNQTGAFHIYSNFCREFIGIIDSKAI